MSAHRGQAGISLIEMMIAMTLGLLLMAGVYSVYLSTRQSSVMTEALASRQEAIRYISARISQDARMAGYRGCIPDDDPAEAGRSRVRNILNPAPGSGGRAAEADGGWFSHPDFLYRFERFVEGFDGQAAAWAPALPAELTNLSAGNDVLTIRATVGTDLFLNAATISRAVTPAPVAPINLATLPLNQTSSVTTGNIALIADCGGATIFQITSYTPDTGVIRFTNTGLNAVGTLGPFEFGAQLSRIATISYFIRPSANGGGPALWRADNATAEEIAEGIERMQVQYGEDTDGDRVADIYRNADAFADTEAWRRVASVRVALLVASTGGRAGAADNRSFDLLGTSVGPFTDGRLRRVVTLTFALRNRLP